MKLSDFIQQHSIDSVFKNGESWVILSEIEQDIKRKVEEFGVPLGKWNIKISRGLLTGCNEAFIIDDSIRQKILDNCKDNSERQRTDEIIRPILRGRDIKRGGYDWAGLYIILAHNGYTNEAGTRIDRIDINHFSAIKEWLDNGNWNTKSEKESNQKRLATRIDKGDTPYNLRNCAYMDDFDRQKILYSEIVRSPQFFLDDEKFVPEATSFVLSGEHLEYLVEYLNSPIVAWIFKTFYAGGGLGESGFRYKKKFLVKLPIPRSFDVDITESSITESSIAESYHLTDAEISFISSSLNSKAE